MDTNPSWQTVDISYVERFHQEGQTSPFELPFVIRGTIDKTMGIAIALVAPNPTTGITITFRSTVSGLRDVSLDVAASNLDGVLSAIQQELSTRGFKCFKVTQMIES